ncbi:MAG: glycine cleavage system aminomethyltransferase GcvT, partial [Prolixibacteraceae bacterium]|nr:glycine cleavage system aminomethyltransferase GcvT [Prolixibacteraceae bacterium]
KLVEFAGYEMPIEYSGIIDEHMAVRNSAGVFDVSHMGEFLVEGRHALDLISKITSNDPRILQSGQAQYTCFPNGRGGIIDDLLVYCLKPEKYMLVVNAANIEKDWNWVKSQNTVGADLYNISDDVSQLAVQGPKAVEILQKLTDVNLSEIRFYTFKTGKIAGVDNVNISATGYTGAGGFELYFPNNKAELIWNAIFEAGKEVGIKPVGLGARDTLRLEMGYCLYGNDIDDTTSPIEAGLGWITKFNNNRDFVDSEYLKMQKNEGVEKRLKGFVLTERGIPRHGYVIVNSEGSVIGKVTSGTMSPVMGKGIGLGYIDKEYTALGTTVYIQVRNKNIPAEIVKLPFI